MTTEKNIEREKGKEIEKKKKRWKDEKDREAC
jgi:hypothetical protein